MRFCAPSFTKKNWKSGRKGVRAGGKKRISAGNSDSLLLLHPIAWSRICGPAWRQQYGCRTGWRSGEFIVAFLMGVRETCRGRVNDNHQNMRAFPSPDFRGDGDRLLRARRGDYQNRLFIRLPFSNVENAERFAEGSRSRHRRLLFQGENGLFAVRSRLSLRGRLSARRRR